jgi:hypothetical protein
MSDYLQEEVIRLDEEVDQIRDEAIPELEDLREDILNEATEDVGDWKEVDDEYIADVEEINDRVKSLRGFVELFQDLLDEDPAARFVLRELSAAQHEKIVDNVNEKSYSVDPQTRQIEGIPKSGHGRILALGEAVQEAPDPLPDEVGDYPMRLKNWLWEQVERLNSAGGEQVEDFSVQEELEKRID